MMRQESRIRFLDVSLDDDRKEVEKVSLATSIRRRCLYARNNAPRLAFTAFFMAINTVLFVTRAYEYSNRNLLEMGARACGHCLNLNCSLLLLLILRRTVTRLRNSWLGQFLPCDQHVHFHKLAGWMVFFLSILHTLFHLANFVNLSEATGISMATYIWDTSLGIGWIGGLANPTGVALLVILTIIVAFSHRIVRKSGYFEVFYWTHLLSLPFWVLLVLHGPNCWKWLLFPGCAFLLETAVRIAQVCSARGQTHVIRGSIMPSHVVKLLIRRPKDFDFKPGEYVYLNIPSIARYEWHPFTISSAPEREDVFTVHIRSVGEWTRRVYEMYQPNRKITEPTNSDSPEQLQKKITGILNPAFTTDNDQDVPEDHTAINVDDDVDNTKGGRYINNLLEFNRKMSVYARPALLQVEAECKPAVIPTSFETKTQPVGKLERKKSSSLSNLAALKAAECHSPQQTDSGRSSCNGSHSSLDSLSDSNCTDIFQQHQHSMHCATSAECQLAGDTRKRRRSLGSQRIDVQNSGPQKKQVVVLVDGPYGTPSTRIFSVSHAVLIGAGIGITPFASILQSVMARYRAAKAPCPYCHLPSCVALPATLRKLRKVDFVWVNRDLGSFEWFLEVLAAMEKEQRVEGAAMEAFLSLHLYKTGSMPLRPSLPLASSIRHGRPDWDKLFNGIRESRIGKVCVFYCGPPALTGILREKCIQYKFEFKREMF
ncbi:NADPH oxidase 5-like [Macrobrachium rosenbergii]|uniref:NADPH oxidase 5-like n=1 Tax=Macrobrachium rosenbergii TaxID=79674 RepID=UPI0034D54BD5